MLQIIMHLEVVPFMATLASGSLKLVQWQMQVVAMVQFTWTNSILS